MDKFTFRLDDDIRLHISVGEVKGQVGGTAATTVSPFHPIAPYVTGAAGSFAYTETEEG